MLVTSGTALPEALPEIAIVGRFACVVNTVVPFLFTSTISVAPVGAVLMLADMATIVAADGNRTRSTPVAALTAPATVNLTRLGAGAAPPMPPEIQELTA